MAIQTITYDDKVALNENPSVAEINQVTDNNMNEIKSVVNNNASETSTNTTNIATNTNDITNLKNLVPTTLYNNSSGSNGAITLSDSVANYSYLEIYFHTNDGANYSGSQKLPVSSGAILTSLQYLHCDAAGHYWIKGKEILINGTSIANNGYIETGTNGTSASNCIYITRVLGYK